ncbi:subtilisin-like protein [Hypoxylon sp. FL1150]|nr:subtilisin-like protein [Hypoxylon sp. FL1150]
MKIFNLALVALAPLALAKAILMGTDTTNGIADNYIVVMKTTDQRILQAHYQQMNTSAQRNKEMKGIKWTYGMPGFNGYHIECDNSTLATIRNDSNVDYVVQDNQVTTQAPISSKAPRSNTPAEPWGLGRISHRESGFKSYVKEAPAKGAMKTYAYIVDSGIRVTHQEFGGRATFGHNFIDGSPDTDENGQGTHIAGIVGGNTVGVDNSTHLIAVKVLGENGTGTVSAGIAGIVWAVNDAQRRGIEIWSVINTSTAGDRNHAQNEAVRSAVEVGMTVVVAAGNDGEKACAHSPASAAEAITVSAIDRCDRRSETSNFGSCVDIHAPGVDIYSAWKDGDSAYRTMSGTSMASPHVAGLATYLMSRELIAGADAIANRLNGLGTRNKVQHLNGDPDVIAFNGNPAELFYDSNSGDDECETLKEA